MNKDYFERMADLALHEFERVTPEQLRRQVLLVLRDVERDTRHQACDRVADMERQIMNMEPPK